MKNILVMLPFLLSCDGPPSKYLLTYFKDSRTNVCFAYVNYMGYLAITAVPCDKVEHLLSDPPHGIAP